MCFYAQKKVYRSFSQGLNQPFRSAEINTIVKIHDSKYNSDSD